MLVEVSQGFHGDGRCLPKGPQNNGMMYAFHGVCASFDQVHHRLGSLSSHHHINNPIPNFSADPDQITHSMFLVLQLFYPNI
jgi:hypothetical protein